jgi:L-threonylcarbamoyladenylate synthase
VKTEILAVIHPQALDIALDALAGGDLVAFPTDTVYGVGGSAFYPGPLDKLYRIKGRSSEKALPVLLGSMDQLPQVVNEMNSQAQQLARSFWPGPLTLVVPRRPELPDQLSPYPTVGVRIPDHPVAIQLLLRSGPLAVTSANRSGQSSAETAEEVFAQLGGRLPLILDGGTTPGGQPSTVVDCSGSELRILRPGPIALKDLLFALR